MKTCYVCAGNCVKDVVHGSFAFWKCADCHTSQVLPQLTELALQSYYDSYHLTESDGGVYDEVEGRMKADFPVKVAMALRHHQSERLRLLDVGCGKGFFVKAAMDKGIDAEGIDFSKSGVEYAVKTLGVRAIAGQIEKQSPSEWHGAFDVATFWATIEHLTDPLTVLRAIHKNLKPGGVLLCDTGLGNVFWERFLPGHSQWYDAPQHMFVFSEEGLVVLMEKAGFTVIHVDTNFERSSLRRWVRWIRHLSICVAAGLVISPLLGRRGLKKIRQEAKWPIGRLITVVARK